MSEIRMIAALSAALLLWLFLAFSFLRKGYRRGEGGWQFLTPGGHLVEQGLTYLKRKLSKPLHRVRKPRPSREQDEVRRYLTDTVGKEEGERQYREYRARRWGSLVLSLAVVLSAYGLCRLAVTLQKSGSGKSGSTGSVSESTDSEPGSGVSEGQFVRPEYGEGSERQRVVLRLRDGDETMETTLTLTVPEKNMTWEEAKQYTEDGAAYLVQTYEGMVVAGDTTFPTALGSAGVTYRSEAPELIRSNGTLKTSPGDSRQPVRIFFTVALGEATTEGSFTLEIAAFSELTLAQKKDLLLARVKAGDYIREESVELPGTVEGIDRISWQVDTEEDLFLWALLLVLVPLLSIIKQDSEYKQSAEKRTQAIRSAYPELVGELAILMGAGLSLKLAWLRIASDYRKRREDNTADRAHHRRKHGSHKEKANPLLEEVIRTAREMEEGASVREALLRFSDRIPVREVRRFVQLLSQTLRRGDSQLLSRLRELSDEAWEMRKKEVREKAEEADTRLLVPLMMMLIVILIMVISPAIIEIKY